MSSVKSKKSPVWKYFVECTDSTRLVQCKLCDVRISRGGEGKKATATGMINHVKNKHNHEFLQLQVDSSVSASTSQENAHSLCQKPRNTLNLKQQSLSECLEKSKLWDINDARAKEYHYLIGEMLAVDNEAISMVDRLGFTRLMKKAVPRYNIPSRSYFIENIIPDIYKKTVDKLKKNIARTSAISITSDMWTCTHTGASFLSFTGHWVNDQFELNQAVLNMKHFSGSHSGQNITSALLEISSIWDIPRSKIHAVIHDNGANMVKGVRDTGYGSIPCFIHTLQLVIVNSLKIQSEVTEMICAGRKIVTHFNHSSSAQEQLQTIQRELSLPEHKLLQDVTTRWNSTYYMLGRLLEQKRSISLYLTDNSNIPNLTSLQWELLQQVIRLLQPFEEITKIVSSGYSCVSETIPHVATLMRYLNKEETAKASDKLQSMRLAMEMELESRFAKLKTEKFYLLSTLVDPRFKASFFMSLNQAEKTRQLLLLEALKKSCEESSSDSDTGVYAGSPANKKNKRTGTQTENKSSSETDTHISFWNCYNEVAIIVEDQNKSELPKKKNSIARELDAYLGASSIARNDNPYIWWLSHRRLYPYLAQFAAIFLSAPASSVYSERLFSEAGNIYEDKRNRLLPSNAEKLVFLHHNLPLLNFEYNM